MANKSRFFILSAAIAGIVAMTGCAEDPFALVPVSGVVKMDGEPLEGAIISFQPIAKEGSDNSGPGSSGVCDAEGRFTLATQTAEREPGAVVAVHKIRLSMSNAGSGPPPDISSDEDAEPVFEGLPQKYNVRSKLKFTVPEGGTDQANFDLEK